MVRSLTDVLPRPLQRLVRDEAGVSAVEFALILPFMLLLYAGSVELSEALSADRKANRVASTIGDLITQRQSMNATEMANIFGASAAVMRPYPTASKLKILAMAVNIGSTGTQTVAWAETYGGETDPSNGSTPPVTVPTALATPSSQVIVTKVTYQYQSPFSSYTQGALKRATPGYTLQHVFIMKPRAGTSIPFS